MPVARKQTIWFALFTLSFLLGACERQESVPPLSADTVILAFGNSLTYGTGVSSEHSYPSVLAELSGARVINAGVPGEVTESGLKRLPGLLQEHQPDILILCHGGNDILRRKSRLDAKANLQRMVELAQQSGARILLLAVPEFGLFPSAAGWYRQVADATGVALEEQIIPELERDADYKSDTVHFNEAGYRKLAEAVLLALQQ